MSFLLGMNEDTVKSDETSIEKANEESSTTVSAENERELTHEWILEKTGREYYQSGSEELAKERFNSALVLFFKALLSFCDAYLLKEQGESPSSHNHRFRITEQFFPEVYRLLDKDFPFYADSYGKLISKSQVEVIKHDAEVMATKAEIKL